MEEDIEGIKIHTGKVSSPSLNGSDISGKSEFDSEYYKHRPSDTSIDLSKVIYVQAPQSSSSNNKATISKKMATKAINSTSRGIPDTKLSQISNYNVTNLKNNPNPIGTSTRPLGGTVTSLRNGKFPIWNQPPRTNQNTAPHQKYKNEFVNSTINRDNNLSRPIIPNHSHIVNFAEDFTGSVTSYPFLQEQHNSTRYYQYDEAEEVRRQSYQNSVDSNTSDTFRDPDEQNCCCILL